MELRDLDMIDHTCVQSLRYFFSPEDFGADEQAFDRDCDQTFTAADSVGRERELVPNGAQRRVT